MLCRSCGTEIADKAIVCFRCGAPTAAPAATRPARRAGRGARLAAAAAVLLLGAAVLLQSPPVPSAARSFLAGVGLAAAVTAIVWFVAGRSRRR
jgi:hypothetical protein